MGSSLLLGRIAASVAVSGIAAISVIGISLGVDGCSGGDSSSPTAGAEGGTAIADGGISAADRSTTGVEAGAVDAGAPATPESVCRAAALAYCARRTRCHRLNDIEEARCRATADLCPDYYFDSSDRTVDEIATCISQFQNASCTDVGLSFTRPCARRGTRPKGEACVYAGQCATGACSGGITSCGLCVDALTVGMPCGAFGGAPCASGSFCHPTTHLCASSVTYGAEGEACDARSDPIKGCENDLACVVAPGGGTSGTCHHAGLEGEACEIDAFTGSYRCAVGLSCASDETPPTCKAAPPCGGVAASEAGPACEPPTTGGVGDHCEPNLTCISLFVCTNGTCSIYPPSSCPVR